MTSGHYVGDYPLPPKTELLCVVLAVLELSL